MSLTRRVEALKELEWRQGRGKVRFWGGGGGGQREEAETMDIVPRPAAARRPASTPAAYPRDQSPPLQDQDCT